jgi:hypothetical protein
MPDYLFLLFVHKKKKENFYISDPSWLQPREAEQKFFGSFFQKRTSCFYSFCFFLTAWQLQY